MQQAHTSTGKLIYDSTPLPPSSNYDTIPNFPDFPIMLHRSCIARLASRLNKTLFQFPYTVLATYIS